MYEHVDTYIDTLAQRIYQKAHPSRNYYEDHSLYRLYALLARVKGLDTTLEDVHDAWVVWMSADFPGHFYNVPFEELDPTVKDYDLPFVEAIHAVVMEGV